jgi:hypothetical protein
MTVGELIVHLGNFDPKMEVAYQLYSDYSDMEIADIEVLDLCDHGSGSYLERVRPTDIGRHPADKIKQYLCFPGN